jgi:hypothetical protein
MQANDDLLKTIQSLRSQDTSFDYTVDIDDPKIKGYKGYASIEFDLKVVRRYLKALQAINESVANGAMEVDELSQTLERSLYTSSIISYARCFTETSGRGLKLDPNDCFKGANELKTIHQRLMDVRHQHLAHAGLSDNEFIFARANFNVVGNAVDWKISYDIILKISHSTEEILEFISAVDHITQYVSHKKDKSAKGFKDGLSDPEKNTLLKKAIELKNLAQ